MLISRLSLGELGGAAGCFETVLFALLHSGVTGKEAGLLKGRTVLLVDAQKGSGDAMTDGAGLAGNAAAEDGNYNVEAAGGSGELQGLTDDELKGIETEIIVDVTVVDGDLTGSVGEEANSCDGGLSAAGAVEVRLFGLIHYPLPP